MVRLADGDRTAFSVLVDELWPVLRDFAARGLGDEHAAEDVAQEAFLRICSRIADFDPTRDAVSWAFGIASYEVLSRRRASQRRREVHGEAGLKQLVDSAATQDALLEAREVQAALEAVVGTLSAADREAFGLSAVMADSVAGATLRKRRQRALERLKTVWRHLYGDA